MGVPPIPTFGKRLSHCRRARKISQAELALQVGVREKDISRWENDRNTPRDHATIVQLARALGVTTDYLLGASRKRGSNTVLPVI